MSQSQTGGGAPSLKLLNCNSYSSSTVNTFNTVNSINNINTVDYQESHKYEEMRQQQIQTLAEELKQTSMKNVVNNMDVSDAPPVPQPRKAKQRARRSSDVGKWKITSFSVEENLANSVNSEIQCSQETSSFVTHTEHVSRFQQGGFSFQKHEEDIEDHANTAAAVAGHDQSSEEVSEQFVDTCHDNNINGYITKKTMNQNNNDDKKDQKKSGMMKYIPNFLSLLPKPKEEKKIERRSSIACMLNTVNNRQSCSRASSVEAQSRTRPPIFSFLKGSGETPHRTRQESSITSRRNSVVSLQKYSSQEYLNSGSITSNLKVRNNPIMLQQPNENKDENNRSFLSKDGSLYQSMESLQSSSNMRSRHRSGSQSRENYTWNGRNQLSGTGLRVGASVTEPEPKDGLALSRDGGFFMPFGNTENLSSKCKTRRQLKAEEQLRRQQEEEDEKERRQERERRRMKRQEKRIRNRTMSLNSSNRNQLINNQIMNNNTKTNTNMESQNLDSSTEKVTINNNNNSITMNSHKTITEIENIEILTKNTEETNLKQVSCTETGNQNQETTQIKNERNTDWQRFGAEYNEFGELISCGKEPVGGYDGFNWDGEKRDRSGAFLEVGADYEGLVDGYNSRTGATGVTRGRWDNVRRGPVLHVSNDPDFVPDRS